MLDFKICIEAYADYNNGELKGKWHDISYLSEQDFTDLMEGLEKKTGHEEFFCTDYELTLHGQDIEPEEGHLGPCPFGIFKLMVKWEEMENKLDATQLPIYFALESDGYNEPMEYLENGYLVECDGLGEYFAGLNGLDLEDNIINYFDFERYGSDIVDNSETVGVEINGTGYYFFIS